MQAARFVQHDHDSTHRCSVARLPGLVLVLFGPLVPPRKRFPQRGENDDHFLWQPQVKASQQAVVLTPSGWCKGMPCLQSLLSLTECLQLACGHGIAPTSVIMCMQHQGQQKDTEQQLSSSTIISIFVLVKTDLLPHLLNRVGKLHRL